MEIKITKTELLKGLTLVQGVVEKKTTMPILANVLLEAKGKDFSITATDLEVGVNSLLAAEIVKPGKVAVHAKGIYDIVKELPEGVVHITVGDNHRVDISCDRAQFKVVGLSPDEFPSLPKKGNGTTIKVEGGVINQMIEKTSFAMSTDEMRQNLNGVYLEENGGKGTLRMVAIDGHRLSICDRKIQGDWKLPKGVIIPRKGVVELKRLIDLAEGTIDLCIDEKHVIVSNDNTTLVVRLIDGKFPPYKQVMPKEPKRAVAIDRKAMLQALRRVSVLSADRSKGVKFVFSPKNLEISTSNPDFGEAREEMSIKYKGEHFEIGFNARYFIDVLGIIGDDEASFQMGDDTTPCVLKSGQDDGFTHIIMPMRL